VPPSSVGELLPRRPAPCGRRKRKPPEPVDRVNPPDWWVCLADSALQRSLRFTRRCNPR